MIFIISGSICQSRWINHQFKRTKTPYKQIDNFIKITKKWEDNKILKKQRTLFNRQRYPQISSSHLHSDNQDRHHLQIEERSWEMLTKTQLQVYTDKIKFQLKQSIWMLDFKSSEEEEKWMKIEKVYRAIVWLQEHPILNKDIT